MPFDLATAKPIKQPSAAAPDPAVAGGFDLSTAMPASAAAAAAGPGVGMIPGTPPQTPTPEPPNTDDLLHKLISPVDAGISLAGGALTGVAALPFAGNDELARKIMSFANAPKTQTGQKMVEAVGDFLSKLGLQALPGIGGELGMLGKSVGPAARATKDAGRAGVSTAAKALTPTLDPQVAALAKKAIDLGIPLRPDMLGNNKIMRMLGEASEKVPLSGSKGDVRQTAFNRALIKQIGGDEKAERLTPDVFDKAITRSGETIGDVFERTNIPVDGSLDAAFMKHVTNAERFETADVGRIVKNYVEELRGKAEGGVIPGQAFRKLNSEIGQKMRATESGDLRHALSELQTDMHDALQRNVSGETLSSLQNARRQYAIAKMIEPLVAKAPTGDISPSGLMGRVTATKPGKEAMARGGAGETGDLARVGQRFLKEPASTGTAERALTYGALGGGAFAEPHVAGGIYTGANLYNRAGPSLSKAIVDRQEIAPAAPKVTKKSKRAYDNAEKERQYQEWKAKQEAPSE